MANEAASEVDVAVVGGGLVGASAALGVAASGRSVLLIERRQPAIDKGRLGIDIRNVALSPASQALLEMQGVWRALTVAAYRHMRVWEDRGTSQISFSADDVQRQELGWVTELSPATVSLWALLRARPNVECLVGQALDEIDMRDDVAVLKVGDRRIRARLVIGADGARSTLRGALGVTTTALATGQSALASVVETQHVHAATAWQRFLLDGPVALLPGPEPHLSSLVWSQSETEAERRLALADDAFADELEGAVEGCLGRIEAVDRRVVFPLTQMVASTFNPHPRALLIGEAARVVHPLAGLGVNLGLEDVVGILNGLRLAKDPGALGLWQAFARRRKARAMAMVRIMAGFRHLYGVREPGIQWLRNLGVRWLDGAKPLKRQLINEALGLGPIAEQLRRA